MSASAKNQSCDASAIGAAVGEMVGDCLVEKGNEIHLYAKDKYVDKTVSFTRDGKDRFYLSASEIKSKEIQLAIPNTTTTTQIQAIEKSVQYAKTKGVTLVVTKVK